MSTQGNWLESFIIEKSKLIEYLISHDSRLFENEKIQCWIFVSIIYGNNLIVIYVEEFDRK